MQKPLKELVMIEERQEKLLQQLEKLRNQMISMKQHFLTSSQQKVVIPPPKVLKQDVSELYSMLLFFIFTIYLWYIFPISETYILW